MKFIQFVHRYDYGHDFYITLIKYKNYSLLQFSFSWCEYGGLPYLQITSGMGKLFGFLISVGKFTMSFETFARSWNLNYLYTVNQEKYD